ncbi:universal stress protein [Streptomyces sp. TRM68367]|uniref:universal stress protein n=1 Tax=Streptomyces sp. TRM68367 TaxID=2758415 RepID=UPI00165C8934|nr:universal stress protein [Streptomyces sp. TRM68367]MBC9730999.1 universal stress protein [Streptomyces sp. TRM68367]
MVRTVVAGLDGSPESRAAAEWAAREAKLRGLSMKLVHVWEPVPTPGSQAPLLGGETRPHWAERVPREEVEGLELRHPGLDITMEALSGRPADVLADVAKDAELLALGSRGLSGLRGFLVGSVGLAVVSRVERPVVLVRAGEQAVDEHEPDPTGIPSASTRYRPVVVGVDTAEPDDSVIGFAFEAAARRGTGVWALHSWSPSPYYVHDLSVDRSLRDEISGRHTEALAEALAPWRQKYPSTDVVEHARSGSAADQLIEASTDASLVVVGRRVRRNPLGAHIGPVTHAVLHHATAPVAVVSHD